jgi:hypothetical protein
MATSSLDLGQFGLGLLQPKRHLHLADHGRRGGEVFLCVLLLACPPVELAAAEVAVRDERTPATL